MSRPTKYERELAAQAERANPDRATTEPSRLPDVRAEAPHKWGRRSVYLAWRVLAGSRTVHFGTEQECRRWARRHRGDDPDPLRVVPPNGPGSRRRY